ncbi:MAG TPA: hypothetical protein PLB70_03450, partial [Paludibacteraceae bacterium]|nr:hypothetical protein [Paludibacteraceae bacterium]
GLFSYKPPKVYFLFFSFSHKPSNDVVNITDNYLLTLVRFTTILSDERFQDFLALAVNTI